MRITVYNTGKPGKRGVHKTCSRKDLERTAMDYLTMDEDADFDEALEFVEEATTDELIQFIYRMENGIC